MTVRFGMNDVNRGAYVANPDDKKQAAQQQALEAYKANMAKVVARIRTEAGEPKLLFITPSPFDQTVVLEKQNNQPGCNDGLGRCAEIVRELAAKNNGAVVDFHAPLTALNLKQQQRDPFLKTQGAPSIVSKIAVDAAAGRAGESVNAEVTAVGKADGGVTFTVLEKALPFPIDAAAKPVLELLPIEADLNQELLAVTGLADGRYELRIDGAAVGRHTAAEFARGINLACNDATPQFKQAQRVAQHNAQRRNAEAQACSLLNTRRWMLSRYQVNPDDPAAVQAHYDSFRDKTEYNAAMALNYIKQWPRYVELLEEAAAREKDAWESRKPVPHAYAVAVVPTERRSE
jgi:hypothetical protein